LENFKAFQNLEKYFEKLFLPQVVEFKIFLGKVQPLKNFSKFWNPKK